MVRSPKVSDMAIPGAVREQAEQLLQKVIDRRVPPNVRDRLRMSFETRGNTLTLLEQRPLWDEESQAFLDTLDKDRKQADASDYHQPDGGPVTRGDEGPD